MLNQHLPPPMFVGEHPALDFLNSIAAPKGTEFDWLKTGPDLLDWCVQARLCNETEIAHFRTPPHRDELDHAAQNIRTFREDFRAFIHAASEGTEVPLEHAMFAQIDRLLALGTQHLKLERSPEKRATKAQPATLTSVHTYGGAQDVLARIAAACADLMCEADFRYVRNCEGPTCTLYFLDVSKNHKRRWCTMDVCGNRAKAAAHRKR